ncbi:MAG TPA: class III extradiol ring-cleavage dioxygenase [Minicystis sp.]|nr:class III extradiol ring-cleavage dioxygenase [Minicystis sp.]
MNRRAWLELVAAGALLPAAGACAPRAEEHRAMEQPSREPTETLPVLFLAHGHPFVTKDATWMGEWGAWARALPRPRAILMLSAHWTAAPLTIGATRTVPLVYDFYGFPEEFYRLQYPAPGAPDVAARVRELVGPKFGVADAPDRGLDHGVYVPLLGMYPRADVPVLQASLPTMDPKPLFEIGRALAPLRREGVLIVGSGFLTHNMRALRFEGGAPPSWATEFDAWCEGVLARRDVDALLDYKTKAPGAAIALPTQEHFVPVIAAVGAALEEGGAVSFPITGWNAGAFTKRSLQIG